MNIAVLVKQVPDTWSERKLRASDSTLDRDAADAVINELDDYAIEEGLRLAGRTINHIASTSARDHRIGP